METFLVIKIVFLRNSHAVYSDMTVLYSLELGSPGRFHKMSIFARSVKVSIADILRRTQFQAHLITEDSGGHSFA